MTAPTIAERIADYLGNGGLWNPEAMEHDKVRALLIDCRDYLQSIESQPVPVEPEFVKESRKGCSVHMGWTLQYIDSLQSALQRAQEKRDASIEEHLWKREQLTTAFISERDSLVERAEKAEAINRRMVELLKEPSANMKSAGYGKPDYLAIFKAMSAELLKEVEK